MMTSVRYVHEDWKRKRYDEIPVASIFLRAYHHAQRLLHEAEVAGARGLALTAAEATQRGWDLVAHEDASRGQLVAPPPPYWQR